MKRTSFLIALASLMLFSFGLAHGATEIVLDNGVPSTGYLCGDIVIAGASVQFDFRLTYTPGDGSAITGSSNGFEVYTMNNGLSDNFTPITYDAFAVGWTDSIYDMGLFLNPFSVDGLGADTIGFGGFSIGKAGFVDGFSDTVWWVETTPSTDGDTLCVDSTFYRPSNDWLWSTNSPQGAFGPDWGGPYCYQVYDTSVVAANLVLSNTVFNFSAVEGGANPADSTFTISSDGAPMVFCLSNDSAWLSTDPSSGVTDGTITVSVDISGLGAGTYVDTITVASITALNSPQLVEMNLEVISNNPPVLDPIGPQVVNEGEQLLFDVTASDPDGDPLTLTVDTLIPYFTDHGDDTGTFDWTPGFDDSGLYLVTFIASDGELADSELVEITVNDVNRPPVLDSIRAKVVDEGNTLTFAVPSSDPDGDPVTLTVDTLQTYFTDHGNDTGTFDWTPGFDDSGLYLVTFVAFDGELADSEVVEITVNNVNRPPVLDSIGPKMVNEVEQLLFDVTATDQDGDLLTLTVDTLIPYFTDHGDDTGTFDWTPGFDDSGLYLVTFIAFDGELADSEVVEITVNNVNRPPEIDPVADTTIDECDALVMIFSASDPDGDDVAFTTDTLYDNMIFTDDGVGAAILTFDPDFDQAGAYPLMLYASDGVDTTADTFTITVEECYNLVVTLDTLKFFADSGGANPDTQSFNVSEIGGGAITYTVSESAAWFELNKAGGTTPDDIVVSVDITGLPDTVIVDSVTVSSGEAVNSPIYKFISLVVTPVENNPPVLDSIGPKMVDEGDTLRFDVSASDPDGTTPSLSSELTAGASFTDHGNGTGTFEWIPGFHQAGVYYIAVVASDGILADTEWVEITVNNVNRPPEVDSIADTTIDECDTLLMVFAASDPDGDSVVLTLAPLAANMTFVDSGYGSAYLLFTPDTTQAGIYPETLFVTDGTDTTAVIFTITVEECELPPECVDMILSDTIFYFVDTIDTSVDTLKDTLSITSSGAEFCFEITCGPALTSWLTVSPTFSCTPRLVSLTVDPSGLTAGQYVDTCWVFVDTTEILVCEPNPQPFIVIFDVIDTTTPPCEDTLVVATVPAVPGAQVVVPVDFSNCCDLSAIGVFLEWYSSYIYLDSVSFADSRLADFPLQYDTIDNGAMTVALGAVNDGSVLDVPPGSGNFANMYFSVAVEAPADFYEVGLHAFRAGTPWWNPVFTEDCGEGDTVLIPEFIPGGIVVDTSVNYVCGYVVDTAGNPIPGATVELWANFPSGLPEDMTTTNGSGAFAFSGFTVVPFDLWAYHEGYYPGLVENLNFGETGVMIVLTPVDPVTPTWEWVDFYCGENTFMGEPLPVGSVVDAYDPDGVHCGTFFVTTPGAYGFMPVYRDDPFPPHDTTDEGADPGDTISFFVNGVEALTFGDEPIWTEHGDQKMVCLETGLVITKFCDLMEGWNLVSWNVDHESDYILDVLASIGECLELVMGFEQGGLTYDPDLPEFSTLWYVDHLSGYWIKIKAGCEVATLEITGAPVPVSTPIPVTTGWNLVSYLPDFPLAPVDALATIHDDLMVALGFDGVGLTYIPGQEPQNTLTEMGPCFGYWLKVMQDGDLVYPGGPLVAASQKGGNEAMSAAAPGITPTTRWVNLYSRDLTLDGAIVEAGATVTAHAFDGAKIGSFTMTQDGLFGFMPVYADDAATAEVEGVRAGERFYLTVNGVETNESLVWTTAGDRIEVGSLTAKSDSDPTLPDGYSLNQNYPNPFNPTTTISFTVPASGKARVEIFNILGKLVAVPFDGLAQAGTSEVIWDGRNFAGESVASGIYFYRLTADRYTETKKMTLMK